MLKNFKLESPYVQYFIGLLINLVVIVILTGSHVSFHNLLVPENKNQNNIWKYDDAYYYVLLAKNYLKTGVVGKGQNPSAARTVGYPIYLSLMISIFGKNWQFLLFYFQAVIFALIYPLFTAIIKLLFGENSQLIICCLHCS